MGFNRLLCAGAAMLIVGLVSSGCGESPQARKSADYSPIEAIVAAAVADDASLIKAKTDKGAGAEVQARIDEECEDAYRKPPSEKCEELLAKGTGQGLRLTWGWGGNPRLGEPTTYPEGEDLLDGANEQGSEMFIRFIGDGERVEVIYCEQLGVCLKEACLSRRIARGGKPQGLSSIAFRCGAE